jgi:hypothetical protein
MDPVTISIAISTAGKAFELIKKGFEVGRDIESMGGDLQRWMGASADIQAIETAATNPGLITKLLKGSSNLEAAATQAVLAKKQLERQRYELKLYISMKYGPATWDEILRVEGNLRRQRQAALQARQEQLRNLVIGAILFVVLPIGFGLLYFFAVYLKGLDG